MTTPEQCPAFAPFAQLSDYAIPRVQDSHSDLHDTMWQFLYDLGLDPKELKITRQQVDAAADGALIDIMLILSGRRRR